MADLNIISSETGITVGLSIILAGVVYTVTRIFVGTQDLRRRVGLLETRLCSDEASMIAAREDIIAIKKQLEYIQKSIDGLGEKMEKIAENWNK